MKQRDLLKFYGVICAAPLVVAAIAPALASARASETARVGVVLVLLIVVAPLAARAFRRGR